MNLNDFIFPICERPVAINNGQQGITDWDNISTFLTSDYKAIVREDTNEPISIVKNSYQVVPNEKLINKLIHTSAHRYAVQDQRFTFMEYR